MSAPSYLSCSPRAHRLPLPLPPPPPPPPPSPSPPPPGHGHVTIVATFQILPGCRADSATFAHQVLCHFRNNGGCQSGSWSPGCSHDGCIGGSAATVSLVPIGPRPRGAVERALSTCQRRLPAAAPGRSGGGSGGGGGGGGSFFGACGAAFTALAELAGPRGLLLVVSKHVVADGAEEQRHTTQRGR